MPNTAYLCLGSNIEPEDNLKAAIRMLATLTNLVAVSSVWETKPLGLTHQSNFLNAAVIVETDLSAAQLKQEVINRIEQSVGRVRQADKNAPRPVDIDLMLFNRQVFQLGNRHIPDPEIVERPFVAIPLAEIAPDYQHPETGQTLSEIARNFDVKPEEMRLRQDVSQTLTLLKFSGTGKLRNQEEEIMKRPTMEDLEETFQISPNGNQKEAIKRQKIIEKSVRKTLMSIGEDPDREGLQRTPERVARMYDELTAGYYIDPEKLINDAMFDVDYSEMVIVKDIDFYSLCEHHLLPFFGRAHVAYIPKGKVVGLSKIPRIVEMFARRLQVQERMTQQIADFIEEVLQPHGVAVVVEAAHMCSMMRGVKKANAMMTTSALFGTFKNNPESRAEFMEHIGRRRFDD